MYIYIYIYIINMYIYIYIYVYIQWWFCYFLNLDHRYVYFNEINLIFEQLIQNNSLQCPNF